MFLKSINCIKSCQCCLTGFHLYKKKQQQFPWTHQNGHDNLTTQRDFIFNTEQTLSLFLPLNQQGILWFLSPLTQLSLSTTETQTYTLEPALWKRRSKSCHANRYPRVNWYSSESGIMVTVVSMGTGERMTSITAAQSSMTFISIAGGALSQNIAAVRQCTPLSVVKIIHIRFLGQTRQFHTNTTTVDDWIF